MVLLHLFSCFVQSGHGWLTCSHIITHIHTHINTHTHTHTQHIYTHTHSTYTHTQHIYTHTNTHTHIHTHLSGTYLNLQTFESIPVLEAPIIFYLIAKLNCTVPYMFFLNLAFINLIIIAPHVDRRYIAVCEFDCRS